MSLITPNTKEYQSVTVPNVTKSTKAVPSGFSFLRHPKHLLLPGANNRIERRNVIITQRFHAAPEIFSGVLNVYCNCKYFP